MGLRPTEIRIMELFINNIFLELSINAIAKRIDRHYRVVRVNILSLLNKNIVKSTELAGARVISLNMKQPNFGMYMGYIEESYAYEKIFKILPQIDDIIAKAREISPFFCLGVFGSYADNTFRKGSDIDVFLICNKNDEKIYQNMIRQFPAIEDMLHWNVFSSDEFSKGLKAKGLNVYKEIIKNKIILKDSDIFYNIIAEAGEIGKD